MVVYNQKNNYTIHQKNKNKQEKNLNDVSSLTLEDSTLIYSHIASFRQFYLKPEPKTKPEA